MGDGQSIFHSATTSLCSHCATPVPAKILLRDGAVYLAKHCPQHGAHEELLEEDAAFYLRGAEFDRPGTPTRAETGWQRGCPYDCGLCPEHEQHTCLAVLEITRACDLNCPVCFADAGQGAMLDLPTIERMLDAYQEAEHGQAEVLQVSGGEPTLHPALLPILRLARAKGIRYLMLNTNGLRLAEEPDFAAALAEVDGFEVYLQFDGLDPAASLALRGRDLTAVKQRAIANLAAHGVPVMLVVTVQQGFNDGELGAIFEYALRTPNVRGINFQPLAFFGRVDGPASAQRITRTGVLRRLEQQTGGMLRVNDFIPLPCNVDRVAVTMLTRDGSRFMPIPRQVDLRPHAGVLGNTLSFYPDAMFRRAMEQLSCAPGACQCFSLLRDVVPLAGLSTRAAFSRDKRSFTTEHLFRISVTSFLDRFTYEQKAMQKECVHVLTPDLRRIPFSAYNLLHRAQLGEGT